MRSEQKEGQVFSEWDSHILRTSSIETLSYYRALLVSTYHTTYHSRGSGCEAKSKIKNKQWIRPSVQAKTKSNKNFCDDAMIYPG